jgi:hypothetical protein
MKSFRVLRAAAACALTAASICPNPAAALDNPLTVNLHGSISHLQEAAATIFGSGSNVLIDVTRYRSISDGAAVTLNTGTCPNPGAVAFTLSPFTKDGSITQLRQSIAVVAARAHSMVIHQTADITSPAFACGNVKD